MKKGIIGRGIGKADRVNVSFANYIPPATQRLLWVVVWLFCMNPTCVVGQNWQLTLRGDNPMTNECHSPFVDPGARIPDPPVAIAAGGLHSLALKADGSVIGWGNNDYGQSYIPAIATNIAAIAAGGFHNLALRADGIVIGWGYNMFGESTGMATGGRASGVVAVENHILSNVVAVAARGYQSWAVKADGSAEGWGANAPPIPANESNIIAVAPGGAHVLLLKADGSVAGYGDNTFGQIDTPASATNVVAIGAGDFYSLALKADGTVVGWGTASVRVPPSATNVSVISAGRFHSLSLRADGSVVGWGSNSYGESDIPADVTNVVAIATGFGFNLALKADGSMVGWGWRNYDGQTTIPANVTDLPVPILVSGDVNPNVPGSYTLTYSATNSPLMPPINYLIGFQSNAVVHIEDNDPRPTNQPPVVQLTTPTNGTTFRAPADILICAAAGDPDGYVRRVEFFAGNHSLGVRTNSCPGCPGGPANPFCLVWSNVPPGDYVLRAKATDNLGAMSDSDLVRISVGEAPPRLPLVTLSATDGLAAEPCLGVIPPDGPDPGRFTVRRDGGTNVAFLVNYSIGGSASNGVDYAALSGSVTIPAGRYEADIPVHPSADAHREGPESVVLRLQPIVCIAIFPPPPECYQIGLPHEAVVIIRDCEPRITNAPPKVAITAPTNGAVFAAPVNIPIAANTVDADGYVWRVEFFANDHKIGEDSKLFLVPPPDGTHIGYDMVWTNPPPGLYSLRARAHDAAGASAFSEPVRISVTGTHPPMPTNFPPVVSITAVDSIAAEGTNCWRWYTNRVGWHEDCRTNFSGPNTATFIVRRHGATNASLSIPYAIHGSASNGVDYAELSGRVTIPAGERSAAIVVVPVDDSIPEPTETVILGLLDATDSPPNYRIGWPGKAAAIIVDNDKPLPDTRVLVDGTFHLSLPATNNFRYRLESSLDMIHWVTLDTNVVTDFTVGYVESQTTDFPSRFYRVVPQ